MKKIISLLLVLMLAVCIWAPAFADSALPHLIDGAGLLSDEEFSELESELDGISEAHNADIAVVTVNSLGSKTAEQYADDYYDYNGYSKSSGVLFLLSMGERKWHISTTGQGINVITDAGLDAMKDKFVSDLSDGYYFDAFMTFAKQTDKYYVKYETDGKGYDVDDLPRDDFSIGFNLLIAVVAGFVIGFIGVSIMKGKLKTVRMQNFAGEYEIPGSMQVTGQNDVFLYANVVATPKPEPSQSSGGGSSTHSGSSGTSHGGGGGSF